MESDRRERRLHRRTARQPPCYPHRHSPPFPGGLQPYRPGVTAHRGISRRGRGRPAHRGCVLCPVRARRSRTRSTSSVRCRWAGRVSLTFASSVSASRREPGSAPDAGISKHCGPVGFACAPTRRIERTKKERARCEASPLGYRVRLQPQRRRRVAARPATPRSAAVLGVGTSHTWLVYCAPMALSSQ